MNKSKWIRIAFVFVSIIFFSPFLLLVTPSFGQEDESAGQQEDIQCLQWKEKSSCEKFENVLENECTAVLSPVMPSGQECQSVYVSHCTQWATESYCIQWEGEQTINAGDFTLHHHDDNGHWYTEAETQTQLADILNQRLDNAGLGTTINNPILPSDVTFYNGTVTFHITITITIEIVGTIQWCDPVIAVGYDYFIDHGPSVKDIKLPEGIGDNRYNLWLFDPELNDFKDSGVELVGGEKYTFEKPIKKFSIRGIEVDAELDPENQRAFPTGLAFEKTGKVSMRMVPITVDTDKQ